MGSCWIVGRCAPEVVSVFRHAGKEVSVEELKYDSIADLGFGTPSSALASENTQPQAAGGQSGGVSRRAPLPHRLLGTRLSGSRRYHHRTL